MSATRVALILSAEERDLVEALRDVPESPLRFKLVELLRALFAYARQPRCSDVQADGVPCDNPSSQCDQCSRVTRLLDDLVHRATE